MPDNSQEIVKGHELERLQPVLEHVSRRRRTTVRFCVVNANCSVDRSRNNLCTIGKVDDCVHKNRDAAS
jgi:dihydropteroate synthase